MEPVRSARPATTDVRDDAVTTAALAVVRRALVEGVPVIRDGFEAEASFALGENSEDAMRQVDAAAQRLGISSLS
jgi:imidazolonepropionase-like amidohydrolase